MSKLQEIYHGIVAKKNGEVEGLCEKCEHSLLCVIEATEYTVHDCRYFLARRPHERWLHHENGVAYCSGCETDAVEDGTNFCPECGAKMDLEGRRWTELRP